MFCVVALSLSIVAAAIPPSQVLDASKSRYCCVRDGSVMKVSSREQLVSVFEDTLKHKKNWF